MDDGALYTGVDNPNGQFGNEIVDDQVKAMLDEERAKLAELTPQLESIIEMIDAEKAIVVDFITSYVDGTNDSEEDVKAELKAAGRYRKYLDDLKTKFKLQLQEAKK